MLKDRHSFSIIKSRTSRDLASLIDWYLKNFLLSPTVNLKRPGVSAERFASKHII